MKRRDWPTILRDAQARDLAQVELARELGINRAAVCQATKRYCIQLRHRKPGRDEIVTRDLLLDARDRGLSGAQLAREIGVTKAAITYAQERHGVRLLRYHPKDKPAVYGRKKRLEDAFLAAVEKGEGFNAFCIRMRSTHQTIERLEKKHKTRLARWVRRHTKPKER